MGSFSIWHWMIVLVIALLLFGGNKFSSLAGDVAKGVKTFKKEMRENDDPVPSATTLPLGRPPTDSV